MQPAEDGHALASLAVALLLLPALSGAAGTAAYYADVEWLMMVAVIVWVPGTALALAGVAFALVARRRDRRNPTKHTAALLRLAAVLTAFALLPLAAFVAAAVS